MQAGYDLRLKHLEPLDHRDEPLHKRPERFVGLHFFNPVPLMKLVEVVRTMRTDARRVQAANAWCMAIGKTVVNCGDTTGFVVNRLLVPYMLDAMRVLEQGLASRDDIDNAMKLGCGYPMGPLFLTDYVGLDTTYSIAEIMFDEFKEPRFAPPPLLKRMVLAGLPRPEDAAAGSTTGARTRRHET